MTWSSGYVRLVANGKRSMIERAKNWAITSTRSVIIDIVTSPAVTTVAARMLPRLTILTYHWLGPTKSNLLSGQHNVSVETFEAQMAFLARNNLAASLDSVAGAISTGRNLGNCVAVTFDDALSCIADIAQPILERYAIPATIFVSGSLIDNRCILWRHGVKLLLESNHGALLKKKIRELDPSGSVDGEYCLKEPDLGTGLSSRLVAIAVGNAFHELGWNEAEIAQREGVFLSSEQLNGLSADIFTLGNHSWSHPVFATLDIDEQKREIEHGASFLSRFPNLERPYFAIPFGLKERHYREQTLTAATASGVSLILTSDKGRESFPLKPVLGRISAPRSEGAFPSYISGSHPDLYRDRALQIIGR